jgi:hypothetical protein
MGSPSLGLQKALVGDTFYCIIGHPMKSTKKTKQMHVSTANQDLEPILQESFDPSLEIQDVKDPK